MANNARQVGALDEAAYAPVKRGLGRRALGIIRVARLPQLTLRLMCLRPSLKAPSHLCRRCRPRRTSRLQQPGRLARVTGINIIFPSWVATRLQKAERPFKVAQPSATRDPIDVEFERIKEAKQRQHFVEKPSIVIHRFIKMQRDARP